MLFATAWTQHAVEHDALLAQAYRAAATHLDTAFADPTWRAALEQPEGDAHKPPAIVLDIDETVLDNSPYAVRILEPGGGHTEDAFEAWCHEVRAEALTGALDLTQAAASMGYAIFYVSNRPAAVEAPTRKNLALHGFPLSEDVDTVLLKNERSEWTSDKSSRRAHIAQTHRIAMLIGDDLGDFVGGAESTVAQRDQAVADHHHRWGREWHMLPNPMYGSWERSLYSNSPATDAARLQAVYDALRR